MRGNDNWVIVTVTFNSAQTLRRYWADRSHREGARWVVVDNASADGSADVAEELGATVVRLSKNLGFGAANNIGMRHDAGSRYVAFVNPDVAVDFSSLGSLQKEIDTRGAIVAPQLVNEDRSLQPNGRGYPTLPAKIMNRISPNRNPAGYRLFAAQDRVQRVAWLTGAAVLGLRSDFERLGPWDEWFFVYHEDADLGMRSQLMGVPQFVIGNTQWLHGWARETTGFNWSAWKLELSSARKFYSRYPEFLFGLPISRRISRRASRWESIEQG